ncbi:MAG: class I SAM-dependent methyltransferase, partial [Aureliella sp.]
SGWEELRGKSILDFGCGAGRGSIEMAQHGARRVIGLDIRSEVLETAKDSAEKAGLAELCQFVQAIDEPVDIIVSVDAFEHFGDPAEILSIMAGLLKDDGKILVSFGPTWYHPRGGHGFSIFPWSHLIFSERAQMRWRSDFRNDGATRFSEISGGLNQMTIKRFLKLVAQSPLRIESFRTVPIQPLKWAHNRLTREFTTSIVECVLSKGGNAES